MRWWPFVWKSAHEEALAVVQQSRDDCWAKYKQEQNANQKLRQQAETIFFEKAGLISIKKEMENGVAALRAELAKVQKENQVLRTAMRGLEIANAEQSKELVYLKIELGVAVESFNALSDEKSGIEAQMTNSDAEYLRLLAIIENLEAALSAANEEITIRDARITDLKLKIEEWRKDGRMKTQHINKCRDELDMIKSTVEKSAAFISEVVLNKRVDECAL
jgi:chromosome segregation ATPase